MVFGWGVLAGFVAEILTGGVKGQVLLHSRVRQLSEGRQMPLPAHWSAKMLQQCIGMVLHLAGFGAKSKGPRRRVSGFVRQTISDQIAYFIVSGLS